MADKPNPIFKQIDDALAAYFRRLGFNNYRNDDGIGKFQQYIDEEELDDPSIPIEEELADPHECTYEWMDVSDFPLPSFVNLNNHPQQKEAFMFYILQYCYKYAQAPSDHDIRSIILPKCMKMSPPSPPMAEPFTEQRSSAIADSNDGEITFNHSAEIEDDSEDIKDNDSDEGVQAEDDDIDEDEDDEKSSEVAVATKIERIGQRQFIPKYPARAHLNIFTAKELTSQLRQDVIEAFENDALLYYYTDISTALQINDKQMKEFSILKNGKPYKLSIINYDLHHKVSRESLYGVVVPNDAYKKEKQSQDKWAWTVDEYISAADISERYGILLYELPKSSRNNPIFQQQLQHPLIIKDSLIDLTDWFNIQQIKSLKRNVQVPKVTITLSKEMWIAECKKSLNNVNLPLIPIVVNKSNRHWIEWIKIISLETQGVYAGISCKFDVFQNKWSVESICLDPGDIYNKHRLVGLRHSIYKQQLDQFKTSLTEIIFSDNESNDVDKKINVLRQQITNQQNSIVRLKEQLHKARNAVVTENPAPEIKAADEENEAMKQQIQYFDGEEDMAQNDDVWISHIIDDVMKNYDVLGFRTTPIGIKLNIYVEKSFMHQWKNVVTPRFYDEQTFYLWLDYTAAMQMIHGYSKQYINQQTRKFMIAVINTELRDMNGKLLFGIIVCYDKSDRKNDKYPYKLQTLMTKKQIKRQHGIHSHDLPKKSRKHPNFINKLLLKRRLNRTDLNKVNLCNLRLQKAIAPNHGPSTKSLTITQKVMKDYCQIALERLINDNGKGSNNLVPILVVDKHTSSYDIEWVMIIHIIHRNCHVGVSFRYSDMKRKFVATTIFLDKGEMESKHKLIGLKEDYCKHIKPFSMKKFKFKNDKSAIIDDDDDIALSGDNENVTQLNVEQYERELNKYKKALHNEQAKANHLKNQMARNTQIFQQEMQNLQHQNEQYVLQQQIQQQMLLQQQQQQQQQLVYDQIYAQNITVNPPQNVNINMNDNNNTLYNNVMYGNQMQMQHPGQGYLG